MKICGVVIWYNPGTDELNNIKTYIDDVDKLFIIDNSNKNNLSMLDYIECDKNKIEYISNMDNLGIAKALNIGCNMAINLGYKWVLTMDQDSKFPKLMASNYIENAIQKLKQDSNIAIFGLKISDNEHEEQGYVDRVITSGNLLNLDAYTNVGGFDNELFIDEVDHDLSFKIIQHGYNIYKFNDVKLDHKIGNTKSFRILNMNFLTMNHNYIRKYYIVRNRFIMRDRYANYTQSYLRLNIVDFIKVILVEDDKIRKMKYMIKGYLDYKKGKLGKINI